MIELYYWPTPNGHKVTIFLEETGLPYTIKPVDISAGQQFEPEFLKFSANNRVPAIIDRNTTDGGAPITVFESGAILVYLAEKTGQFLPTETRAKKSVLEWLFWQMGGLGPMAGQNHHFVQYAPDRIPYAMDRLRQRNLQSPLWRARAPASGTRLAGRRLLTLPTWRPIPGWSHGRPSSSASTRFRTCGVGLTPCAQRPAVVAAYGKGKPWSSRPAVTEEGNKAPFWPDRKNL